ncbi:hypothetical protein cand_007950 [Cryptosporidium andersoni]|uniref:HMG box domain-containing protein n=1 Tax=Cryptosporidium andersoni TaxID=117008 RepID=A0A1J4MP75_9CRYT|nr:hypothetical protein cand_007950 [Cryptosporidium andersoni]
MGYGGVNQRAIEARERKMAAALEKKLREQEKLEDEKWVDNDKHANRKLERKREAIQKHEEKSQRKAELRKIYEEEDSKVICNKATMSGPKKLTKAEITQRALKFAMQRSKKEYKEFDNIDLLVENPNRVERDKEIEAKVSGIDYISASSLDDALAILTLEDKSYVDKHPEKRMKAAWLTFLDNNMPQLKSEFPNYKRSQLLQILQKRWKKAPENPCNQ